MDELHDVARTAIRRSRRWVRTFARIGYASIGIVYLSMAALAFLGLFTSGGQYTGPAGAARTLRAQPYGNVMLGCIAVGLLVYVAWRFAQAVLDVEHRGHKPQGLARRAGLALSGLSYAGLAVFTIAQLTTGAFSVDDPKDDWTRSLLTDPLGAVVVGILGAAVLTVGAYQFYGAFQAGFMRFMNDPPGVGLGGHWFTVLGRVGLAARGVVFGLVGWFVVSNAWQVNAEEPMGLGGALRVLARQTYGRWLLGAVAAGLAAYGFYMLAKTGIRRMHPSADEPDDREEAGGEQPSGGDRGEQARGERTADERTS